MSEPARPVSDPVRTLEDVEACLNCAEPLVGDYCAACGQRARNPRRLVIGLVQDVIVDTVSVDSKLYRTLRLLFWRPGRLARNYIDGKRVRYTAPFRLYLFSSLIFFLLAWSLVPFDFMESSIAESHAERELERAQAAESETVESGLEPIVIPGPDGETIDPMAILRGDRTANELGNRAEAADGEEDANDGKGAAEEETCEEVLARGDFPFNDWSCLTLDPTIAHFEAAGRRAQEDPRLFFAQIRNNVPRVMLLAPLVYAVMLTVLYVYRRQYMIYDHLVVSLYMHAALYAYLSAAMLAAGMPVIGDILVAVILIYAAFQPIMVFRQAYQSGWISTLLKFTVSNTAYLTIVGVLLILGIGVALYQS